MTNMNGLSCQFKGALLVALLFVGNFASAFAATVKDIRLGVTQGAHAGGSRPAIKCRLPTFSCSIIRAALLLICLPAMAGKPAKGSRLWQKFVSGSLRQIKAALVIDAKGPVKIAKSFMLPASSGLPHRLVIGFGQGEQHRVSISRLSLTAPSARQIRRQTGAVCANAEAKEKPNSKPIIVLDAGHGGVDPGALGRKAREKKRNAGIYPRVCQAIARHRQI